MGILPVVVFQYRAHCHRRLHAARPGPPPPLVTVFWPIFAFSSFSLTALLFRLRGATDLLFMGIIVDVDCHARLRYSARCFFSLVARGLQAFCVEGGIVEMWIPWYIMPLWKFAHVASKA